MDIKKVSKLYDEINRALLLWVLYSEWTALSETKTSEEGELHSKWDTLRDVMSHVGYSINNDAKIIIKQIEEYSNKVIINTHFFGNSSIDNKFYSDQFNDTYRYNMVELKAVNPIHIRKLLSYLRATKMLLGILSPNDEDVKPRQFVKTDDEIIRIGDFGYTNAEHAGDILITYKNKPVKLEPKWKIVARAILRNAKQEEATPIDVIIAELEQHNTRGTTYDNIRIHSTVCKINDSFYRVLKRRPIEIIHEKGYSFHL